MPLQDLPLEGEEKKILSSSPTIKSNDSSVEKVPDKEDQSVVKGKATQKPKILPLPNGPYYLLNDTKPKVVENLRNSKGQELSTVSGVALCRCGASANKPFCDGTHNEINFKDEKN
jgi:CDGSH-type Zn-finger protein